MQAIVAACRAERWPAQVVAVLANRADAAGLEWARAQGIPTACIDHRAWPDRPGFDAALQVEIDRHQPDVVALAGFMRILTPGFVRHYQGRLLNIHPSLLPAFPGLKTHEQALAAGVRVHGATVHFVTDQLDHGPIVAQAVVPVLPDDAAATLAARVLEQEHVIYPRALRWLVEGRIGLTAEGAVRFAPDAADAAAKVLVCAC